MSPGDLWEELKRRRVVRVVVAYAAAVFVVLQVADLLVEPLGLPAWVFRFLLMLALIGLPVTLALAWAFDITRAGVTITADDPTRRAVQGRWVVAGGAFLAAGVGIWYFGGSSQEAVADGVDPSLIAVVPFRVSSAAEGLSYLGEGALDLLAPFFSEAPRMVDVSTMVSAWRRALPPNEDDLPEGAAVELAGSLGAGRLLVASVVGSPSSFTVTARLLQVPGGDQIGSVTQDGSEPELREVFTRVAAQLLAAESGTEGPRAEYLSDIPFQALRAYLDGRREYRRTAYLAARDAFTRALDADDTFALAALGLWEAVAMGLDADRGALTQRATQVLADHRDRLPARDQEYVELRLFASGRRAAVETTDGPRAALVRRLPDKPEAWYHYGDHLFHDAAIVGEEDYDARATAAFERSLELDPGLLVSRQHLLWGAALRRDTAYVLAEADRFIEQAAGTESAAGMAALVAWGFGDTLQARLVAEAIDTMSFASLLGLAAPGGFSELTIDPEVEDLMLDRLLSSAVTAADRRQAVEYRYRYLMNSGRVAEAQEEVLAYESREAPLHEERLVAHLFWDGPDVAARAAARTFDTRYAEGTDPLPYGGGGRVLFLSELLRLREGNLDWVDRTAARLRAAQDDPDPGHGRNALLALTLEAVAAHERASPTADSVVAELDRVLALGPPNYMLANHELARVLEARGDLRGAARAAQRRPRRTLVPEGLSTTLYEGGRLWDAAGEPERALTLYRHFAAWQRRADPAFRARLDRVLTRISEIEGELAAR